MDVVVVIPFMSDLHPSLSVDAWEYRFRPLHMVEMAPQARNVR
jgi:hypothetical protein